MRVMKQTRNSLYSVMARFIIMTLLWLLALAIVIYFNSNWVALMFVTLFLTLLYETKRLPKARA